MSDDDALKRETALNLAKSSQSERILETIWPSALSCYPKALTETDKLSHVYDHLFRRQDRVFPSTTLVAAGLALDDSFTKKAMETHNSAISKAMDAVAKLSHSDDSFIKKATDMQRSAFSNATLAAAGLALNDSFTKRAMETHNSAISKAMDAVAKLSHLDDSFLKDALEWPHFSAANQMADKIKLSAGSESLFWAAVEIGRRTETSENQKDAISNNSFAEKFKSLPLWAQHFVIWVIIGIFRGALEDTLKEKTLESIYKTVSYIGSLTEGKAIGKTDIISSNPEVEWDELNKFRTITGENVRLRKSPSMNSEVIEVLSKNRVVAVIGTKDRQWIFVQVHIGDEKLQGWVNRSYTKRLGL